MITPETTPVSEWHRYGIEIEVKCRSCGLVRHLVASQVLPYVQAGTWMQREALDRFGKRLKCSQCGAKGPETTLVVR